MDDMAIVKQAIRGNQMAQMQILSQYKEQMYRVAYSYMRNIHDANDAVQEMNYQFLKHIQRLESPEYLKTWLVRIVINVCLTMKRKQKRVFVTDEVYEHTKSEHGYDENMNEMNELFALNDAISRLPVEEQELIHLKYFKDLKNSDIALIKQIPEGTVKSRLHNTIKRIKAIIEGV